MDTGIVSPLVCLLVYSESTHLDVVVLELARQPLELGRYNIIYSLIRGTIFVVSRLHTGYTCYCGPTLVPTSCQPAWPAVLCMILY